jgi:hypothetical protein
MAPIMIVFVDYKTCSNIKKFKIQVELCFPEFVSFVPIIKFGFKLVTTIGKLCDVAPCIWPSLSSISVHSRKILTGTVFESGTF